MSTLFKSSRIGNITLSNRFLRSATLEGMADENGGCTTQLIGLYEHLSEGGIGLIITGHTFVSEEGRATPFQLGLYKDSLIPGFRALTDAVHRNEGRIFAQLAHAGVYANPQKTDLLPLAATSGTSETGKAQKECTEDDVQGLIHAFEKAALRAWKAGFDGIELHAAHGYLLSQFLSPLYNGRSDRFGGNAHNRARLLLNTVKAIRKSLGQEYPILVKLNCSDFHEQGLELHESLETALLLEQEGIDGIEISGGLLTSRKMGPTRSGINSVEKEAFFKEEACLFKKQLHIPVILVGGIRSFETVHSLTQTGVCDYVSMCRPFISEPDIVNRWKSGDTTKSRCTSDNLCFRPTLRGEGVSCMRFSKSGME